MCVHPLWAVLGIAGAESSGKSAGWSSPHPCLIHFLSIPEERTRKRPCSPHHIAKSKDESASLGSKKKACFSERHWELWFCSHCSTVCDVIIADMHTSSWVCFLPTHTASPAVPMGIQGRFISVLGRHGFCARDLMSSPGIYSSFWTTRLKK